MYTFIDPRVVLLLYGTGVYHGHRDFCFLYFVIYERDALSDGLYNCIMKDVMTAGGFVIKGGDKSSYQTKSIVDQFLLNYITDFPIHWKGFISSRISVDYDLKWEGHIIASSKLIPGRIHVDDVSILIMGVFNMLLGVPIEKFKYGKFTIVYTMREPVKGGSPISNTLGPAISLLLAGTKNTMMVDYSVMCLIIRQIMGSSELYEDYPLESLSLHFFYSPKRRNTKKMKWEVRDQFKFDRLMTLVKQLDIPDHEYEQKKAERVNNSNRTNLDFSTLIKRLKQKDKPPKSFLVGDIETVMLNDIHTPYAAGFLVVHPDSEVESISHDDFTILVASEREGKETFEEKSLNLLK